MNEILMCGTDPVGQLYKDTKAEATSIAPIEVSPAESSHSVGTHIMVDGVRYRVTSAISVGDTLTIGTNISAENIEDNLNADDIAYDSNNSVKDKIDNDNKIDKIFDQLGIATTYTAYNCNWQNYNLLIFNTQRYGNQNASIVVPKSYFANTGAGERIMIKNMLNSVEYSIYQNGNGSIMIQANSSMSDCGVRVFGIGKL